MVIKSDILLKGAVWTETIEALKHIFTKTTNYSVFMLALSIGIMYDERLTFEKEDDGEKSVPRNFINNNDNGKLDFYFQAAILTTQTENFEEDTRLDLAFGDDTSFNKIGFLTEFANFGVTKLHEEIGDTSVITMENIKNFCAASVEGRNLEIDALPDEILL